MNCTKRTGFCIMWSLVFSFLLSGCLEKKEAAAISVLWEGSKATGIIIPKHLLSYVSKDSLEDILQVYVGDSNIPILGEYAEEDAAVVFRPLIAFTPRLIYKVYSGRRLIGMVEIPSADTNDAPVVVAVYPTGDTLPENLLKFYLKFSEPMKEGESLQHIYLIKGSNDTLTSVFLDLQQELWNKEGTMLTLWLDPGRIKRDLQPNKTLGSPLHKGESYRLVISKDWQSQKGSLLKENYRKDFFTGFRDSIFPDIQTWIINVPEKKTKQQLVINFHESLDHVLAGNTMKVVDSNDKTVNGVLSINEEGTIANFTPALPWKKGTYVLKTESRLEDLAGNNLNRLFDTDLTQKQKEPQDIFRRSFEIK